MKVLYKESKMFRNHSNEILSACFVFGKGMLEKCMDVSYVSNTNLTSLLVRSLKRAGAMVLISFQAIFT